MWIPFFCLVEKLSPLTNSIIKNDTIDECQGRFCDEGRKCENGLNLPLGSLDVFIMENQTQNSKFIMNKRLMVLWEERIKMLITKVQKKYKK